ncbi:hypothetical protein JDN40_10725 [Rhodomicrobium vannielii ATCC 17100]|uniref:hypothetical protein n=1 Tax=Rhodomicrobium vannielii TaxID=1069 RepID=UPI0019190ABB|nr:hypothetical protein [Rhodomicrobium vannielii]MBJ7534578.1 hypothetical protein [Rhodomicrobium vannielii ATCC 17100]
MTGYERLKAAIVSTIIRDIPKPFWVDLRAMARQAYLDVFSQISNDPNMVREQRIDRLRQDRHYRMEHVLSSLADRHGIAKSHTVLAENSQHYVYATKGDIGMTQSYVPAIGELPKPAKYFDRLAGANEIPRLDLGDEPPETLIGKKYYGLIAHNPIGRKFDAEEQKLGMVQFCIPSGDGKAWAVELAIEDLTSSYLEDKKDAGMKRDPMWKDRGKEEEKK